MPPLPHMSSWHRAYLSTGCLHMWYLMKHRDNFTLP